MSLFPLPPLPTSTDHHSNNRRTRRRSSPFLRQGRHGGRVTPTLGGFPMPVRFLLPAAAAAGLLVVLSFRPSPGQTAKEVAPRGESERPAPSPMKTIGVLGGL